VQVKPQKSGPSMIFPDRYAHGRARLEQAVQAPQGLNSLLKNSSRGKPVPLGLKPVMIMNGLRGPEGPLFHGFPDLSIFSANCEAPRQSKALIAAPKSRAT